MYASLRILRTMDTGMNDCRAVVTPRWSADPTPWFLFRRGVYTKERAGIGGWVRLTRFITCLA